MTPLRGDVYLCNLGPTIGTEIRKTRPAVVISPDELNQHWPSCLVAPMTTGSRRYPFRVACRFEGVNGHVVLDQMRVVDTTRLVRRLGRLSGATTAKVLATAREMFAD